MFLIAVPTVSGFTAPIEMAPGELLFSITYKSEFVWNCAVTISGNPSPFKSCAANASVLLAPGIGTTMGDRGENAIDGTVLWLISIVTVLVACDVIITSGFPFRSRSAISMRFGRLPASVMIEG